MRQLLVLRRLSSLVAVAALGALTACAMPGAPAKVALSGAQEVPAVSTSATGVSTISIAADGSVSGGISVQGMTGTMAHIHLAASGQNGPVIVPLAQSGEGAWSVPAGTKLTADQLDAYKAGKLYVNVHSAAYKGGEIRAQLQP